MGKIQLIKMRRWLFFFLTALVLLAFNKKRPKTSCDLFNVVNVAIDATNVNQLCIKVSMEGEIENYITQPYISALTTIRGDTIADGSIQYNRQYGNQTLIYTVKSQFESWPDGVYIAHFKYDSVVCELPCRLK